MNWGVQLPSSPYPVAWMAWTGLCPNCVQIGWPTGDSEKYQTPHILFLTLKPACSCHGHIPTPTPTAESQCSGRTPPASHASHRGCVIALFSWQSVIWYTANYFSPGKPGGPSYSGKFPEQKCFFQNQVKTFSKAFLHSCQICRDLLRRSFHTFLWNAPQLQWQGRFCQVFLRRLSAAFRLARKVTSVLSGAEQDTCKPWGTFKDTDAATCCLRRQREQFQNVFTGNCKEKINV